MGNYSLVWILVSLSAVIAVLAVAIRFGIQRDDGRERRSVLDLGRLRSSFRTAVGAIEANIAGRDKRYDVPWVVLLHDGDAATRPPVEACGISSTLAGEQPAWASDGPRWHLFDRGVVVELESDQLDAPVGLGHRVVPAILALVVHRDRAAEVLERHGGRRVHRVEADLQAAPNFVRGHRGSSR